MARDRLLRWIGLPSAVIAAISLLATFGLDLDRYRPVWIYEHRELASVVYGAILHKSRFDLYNLMTEINGLIAIGERPPASMYDYKAALEANIKEMEEKVNSGRSLY